MNILSSKNKKTLIYSAISLISVIFLLKSIDIHEIQDLFRRGFSASALTIFSGAAFMIVLLYGERWRLLLDRKISLKSGVTSYMIGIGGNMFLPARGGDLLRTHYSHRSSTMPYSEIFSRLFVEKFIDLITLGIVGAVASILFYVTNDNARASFLALFSAVLIISIISGIVAIKYFRQGLIRYLHAFFRFLKKSEFFERHIIHFINDASYYLSSTMTLWPGIITLAMWFSFNAGSYILAAQAVGVTLSYHESLIILLSGALGLMLPAAPSGVGTFHASVVAAFIFLGRSPAEGLLAATAIHFLFFVVYVVPAVLLYGHWRFFHTLPDRVP